MQETVAWGVGLKQNRSPEFINYTEGYIDTRRQIHQHNTNTLAVRSVAGLTVI